MNPYEAPKPKKKKKVDDTSVLDAGIPTLGAGALIWAIGRGAASNKERRNLSSFISESEKSSAGRGYRDVLDSYINTGSSAISTKPYGMDPVDVMFGLRSALSKIKKDVPAWNPSSAKHYSHFSAGPTSAYTRFLDEGIINREPGYDTRKLVESLRTGKDTEGDYFIPAALKYKPARDAYARDLLERTKEIDLDKIGDPGETLKGVPQAINDKAIEYAKSLNINPMSMSPDEQKLVYAGLDGFIKQTDKDLWDKKQIADIELSKAALKAYAGYTPLAKAVKGISNMQYAGIGLAALGGGMLLYKLLKNKKVKKASFVGTIVGTGAGAALGYLIARKAKNKNKALGFLIPALAGAGAGVVYDTIAGSKNIDQPIEAKVKPPVASTSQQSETAKNEPVVAKPVTVNRGTPAGDLVKLYAERSDENKRKIYDIVTRFGDKLPSDYSELKGKLSWSESMGARAKGVPDLYNNTSSEDKQKVINIIRDHQEKGINPGDRLIGRLMLARQNSLAS